MSQKNQSETSGGYRLLKHGEKVRASDEYDGAHGWEKLDPRDSTIGKSWNRRYMWPMRRWDGRLAASTAELCEPPLEGNDVR